MAKNLFLYGRLLLTALCLCILPGSRNVAQQPQTQRSGKPATDFRTRLTAIYNAELGVQEYSDKNDGERVEQYLHYTGLSKGNEWCAAFVSWCYAQAGRDRPRTPWAPALFPNSKTVWVRNKAGMTTPLPGDVFGIWNSDKQRISHVGFVAQWGDKYLISTEGNSHNAVERRRRPVSTMYKVADWATIP